MYGIRDKKSKIFLKSIETYHSEYNSNYELNFADHCVEINYYINQSLGFISSILLKESLGSSYDPKLNNEINQNELEVVDMLTLRVVPLSELLDGCEVDKLPVFVKPLDFDYDDIIIENE